MNQSFARRMASSTAEGVGKPVTVTTPELVVPPELVAPPELPPVVVESLGLVVPPELLTLLELAPPPGPLVEPPVWVVEPPAVEPPELVPPVPPCELAEDEPPLAPPVCPGLVLVVELWHAASVTTADRKSARRQSIWRRVMVMSPPRCAAWTRFRRVKQRLRTPLRSPQPNNATMDMPEPRT